MASSDNTFRLSRMLHWTGLRWSSEVNSSMHTFLHEAPPTHLHHVVHEAGVVDAVLRAGIVHPLNPQLSQGAKVSRAGARAPTHPSHLPPLEAPAAVGVLQRPVGGPHGEAVAVLRATAETLSGGDVATSNTAREKRMSATMQSDRE